MTEATAPAAWSLTLQGRDYPLAPSLPALRTIEHQTGSTIFSLIEAASEGALTIDQMTSMTVNLAVAPENDPLFHTAQMMARRAFSVIDRGRGAGTFADPVAGAIVSAGLMVVMSRLIPPLAAALAGRTTADGKQREPEA